MFVYCIPGTRYNIIQVFPSGVRRENETKMWREAGGTRNATLYSTMFTCLNLDTLRPHDLNIEDSKNFTTAVGMIGSSLQRRRRVLVCVCTVYKTCRFERSPRTLSFTGTLFIHVESAG